MTQWSTKNLRYLLCLAITFLTAQDLPQFDMLIRSERYGEALPRLEAYVQAHPDSPAANYQLGYVYFRTRRMMDAVKSLSACLARDPNHPDAHRVLGYALTALRRPHLAEREFVLALQIKPDSVETLYALGRLRFERGAYGAAAASLRRTIELQPSHVKAQETLGLAYEALNDIEAARRHMAKAVELNQTAPDRSEWPYISYAGFHNRRANHEEALRFAKQAIAMTPGSDAAHFQGAKAYCGLRQWRACASELQASIRIDDKNPEFFYWLSTAQKRLGSEEQAKASLEEFHRLKKWEATSGVAVRIPE